MSFTAYFFGGPLSGQEREIRSALAEYRYPCIPRAYTFSEGAALPDLGYQRYILADRDNHALYYQFLEEEGCNEMKLETTTTRQFDTDREVETKRLTPETLDEAVLLFEHKYQDDRSQREFLDLVKLLVAEIKALREAA